MPYKAIVLLSSTVLLAAAFPVIGRAQVPPGYPPPFPYAYRYAGPDSSVRLVITPKEATVYVDGYFAGHVDDYDGAFQRLRVQPGPHEIVVYLKGYRSLHEKLYLSPNATRKITGKLEPLGAGVPDEPLPEPLIPPGPPPPPGPPGPLGRPDGNAPPGPDRSTYNPI